MTAIPSNDQSRLDVTLDPHNENNLWVSTYYGANGQKVYNSTDGGLVWVNKTTASLDGHSILDILYQGGTNDAVYVLTNYGVLVWDGASSWTDYSVGLPYYTRGLRFKPFYRDNKLRMSSDRGVWEADFLVESDPMAHPMVASEFVYCIRDTIQFEDHSFLNHTNATWAWNFIPAPAYVSNPNARNPKVLFDATGTYDVLLAVTDQNGVTSTDTIIDMITVDNQCFTDTIPGLSMLCQANNGHALVPDLDLPQTDSLTLSAWIKPTGIQDSYSGIVFNDGTSAGINFRAGNELAYHWPGGQWWWNSGLIVDTNQWSHVVLVAKPTGITIYLNGIASTHNFSLSPADIGTMRIGSYQG
ncbi:MAG TPA: hypothetical protein EYO31_05060 [Phycisphaerales bacterium]|nr:hypothetical protein [Phycisphaerales bacterium]